MVFAVTVVTPIGENVETSTMYKSNAIKIGESKSHLIKYEWLWCHPGHGLACTYHASIDCYEKTITFKIEGQRTFHGKRKAIKITRFLAIKAEKLLRKGCRYYLAFVIEGSTQKNLDDIPVKQKFSDVFLDKILGLPPKREMDFILT